LFGITRIELHLAFIVDHSGIFSEFVTLWPSDSDQSLSTQTDQ